MQQIVILGAGTAGSLLAARFVRALGARARVTVVDRDDAHLYQPGLLFLPFNDEGPEAIVRSRRALLPPEVDFVEAEVVAIDRAARRVRLSNGAALPWDLLVVATGARLVPEATEGLTGPGWRESVHEFYSLEGAMALRRALRDFAGGPVLVHIAETPIKCPVAPLEMAFLLDAHLRAEGRRAQAEITYVTPLDGAFTRPTARRVLGDTLDGRGIGTVADFAVQRVEAGPEGGTLVGWDGRALPFRLLITVPVHAADPCIAAAGLGDAAGWLAVDKHTLQSTVDPTVFGLGDVTDLPTSKAGSVAHFAGEVLFENALRALDGRPPVARFDGHATCFVETGDGRAMLLDFNDETEPLPGRFPLPGVGPFTLLEESEMNHWGKLAFRWLYWNLLVKGADLPLDHRMLTAGKWSA